ncbi:Protein of unknown function [Cotesia congregata]|uniref:Uncharacterized protein n=1 Tax=Cotesia congregata TaxID=51543 RepID=A0A8J2HAH8_COTCN|nr:Protein of unknown function [Cotesia congregata]
MKNFVIIFLLSNLESSSKLDISTIEDLPDKLTASEPTIDGHQLQFNCLANGQSNREPATQRPVADVASQSGLRPQAPQQIMQPQQHQGQSTLNIAGEMPRQANVIRGPVGQVGSQGQGSGPQMQRQALQQYTQILQQFRQQQQQQQTHMVNQARGQSPHHQVHQVGIVDLGQGGSRWIQARPNMHNIQNMGQMGVSSPYGYVPTLNQCTLTVPTPNQCTYTVPTRDQSSYLQTQVKPVQQVKFWQLSLSEENRKVRSKC